MLVWGLGDAKRGTRGRIGCREVWAGDVGLSNIGAAGISNIGHTGGNTRGRCNISLFVKMCYLFSMLDSIVQGHIGHLMLFTQYIYLYRSKCTDYLD